MNKDNLLGIFFSVIEIKLEKSITINKKPWKLLKIGTHNSVDHRFASISDINSLIMLITVDYIDYVFSAIGHTGIFWEVSVGV